MISGSEVSMAFFELERCHAPCQSEIKALKKGDISMMGGQAVIDFDINESAHKCREKGQE